MKSPKLLLFQGKNFSESELMSRILCLFLSPKGEKKILKDVLRCKIKQLQEKILGKFPHQFCVDDCILFLPLV